MELETKVSVIMPVYNTDEKEFREAIESILNQTLQDFEFIIIDDCSKEYVKNIVDSYPDSRIVYLRNEKNLGITSSLNKGLSIAKGEFIARMDSDDISLAQRFEKQVDFFNNNCSVSLLGTAIEKFPKSEIVKFPLDSSNIKNTLIFSNSCLAHPSIMIRKSAIDEFQIRYNENDKVCEDYGLWLELVDKLNFANLEEVLLKYRWHKNSISKKKTLTQSAGSQKLMFKAQAKYFNINCDKVNEIIDKYCDNKIFTSDDLILVINFIIHVKELLKNEHNTINYNVNRVFFKDFLRKCVSDINFIKILFSKELNSIIKLTFFEKIGMILGF